jgi:hypothetical protein
MEDNLEERKKISACNELLIEALRLNKIHVATALPSLLCVVVTLGAISCVEEKEIEDLLSTALGDYKKVRKALQNKGISSRKNVEDYLKNKPS